MKTALALGILLVSATTLFGAEKPNILIILTDDQGYADVSAYGRTDVKTPHIDRLAKEGMLFPNMRANCCELMPFLDEHSRNVAIHHLVSGILERSNTVPTVTVNWPLQSLQYSRPGR